MPSEELNLLLKGDINKFLVIRIEDMYRHVTKPVPPTRATSHSCCYVTEGEARMKIGSESYTIGPNEVLFVPAGQVFSFGEKDINKGYLCNFSDDSFLGEFGNSNLLKNFEFLRVWGNPLVKLTEQTAQYLNHIFDRILTEYTQNGLKNPDIIQPYLITGLCEINKAYLPLSDSTNSKAVQLTNRFRELIFTNIRSIHRVSGYAELLHITPNHLNKIVKNTTGKSPTHWIDDAIILEAKVLLYQTTFSVGEISAAVGIQDPSYFNRLFKKQEGITPSQFRKMIETS